MAGCVGNTMCNTDTSAAFDFIARRATTFNYKLTFKVYPTEGSPDDAIPEDLSDSLFFMQVRTITGGLILDLNESNSTLTKLDNTLTVYLTATMMSGIPAGNYLYDLMQQIVSSATVIPRLAGSFIVIQNITQVP